MPAIVTSSDAYLKYQKRKNVVSDDYVYVHENCKRCVGMGAMQATHRQGGARDTIHDGHARPRLYLADANAAEPEHRLGPRLHGAGRGTCLRVAIIGTDMRDNLFPGIDPLGQELRVDGQPYTVIGVGEKQGSTFGAEPGQLGRGAADGLPEDLRHSKTLTIYVKAASAGAALHGDGPTRCAC